MESPTPDADRKDDRSGSGVSLETLIIASLASAAAAYAASWIWGTGTLISAAATPVVVALVSEFLHHARPRRRVEPPAHIRRNANRGGSRTTARPTGGDPTGGRSSLLGCSPSRSSSLSARCPTSSPGAPSPATASRRRSLASRRTEERGEGEDKYDDGDVDLDYPNDDDHQDRADGYDDDDRSHIHAKHHPVDHSHHAPDGQSHDDAGHACSLTSSPATQAAARLIGRRCSTNSNSH